MTSLAAVRDALADRLRSISGLRVIPYVPAEAHVLPLIVFT